MREPKLGEYHYALRGNSWNVYVWTDVREGSASADFVARFNTKDDARAFVYEKNGWNEPKNGLK